MLDVISRLLYVIAAAMTFFAGGLSFEKAPKLQSLDATGFPGGSIESVEDLDAVMRTLDQTVPDTLFRTYNAANAIENYGFMITRMVIPLTCWAASLVLIAHAIRPRIKRQE